MKPGLVCQTEETIFKSRARGYKTFSILNSAENEILNAHMFKKIIN